METRESRIGQNNTGIRVQIDQSRSRQTPKTDFGSVMSTGLSRTADAVMGAGQLAAPYIPGGAILSAAITNVGSLKESAGGQNAGAVGGNSSRIVGGATGSAATGESSALDRLAAGGDAGAVLMKETQKMQEMNQSFNLQYLQLQENMQKDNRQFTALSNIMKTKHDTAKNAIGNVR